MELKYNDNKIVGENTEIHFIGLAEFDKTGEAMAVYRDNNKLCIKSYTEYLEYIQTI